MEKGFSRWGLGWFCLLWIASFSIGSDSSFAVDPTTRRYSDIVSDLRSLAARFPHQAQLFSIGKNDSGQDIYGIRAGVGPTRGLVVSTHHGNEYGSTEVGLAFAHSVAENPIAGMTVDVIPVLNISGYDRRQRREMGFDPNRDYPGPCGTDGPFKLRSTRALAEWIDREKITVSATLHTHSPFVLYPWGFSTKDVQTDYDPLYIDLARIAAQDSGYPVGNSTVELYPADGTYEDYAMWKFGVWSLLFEMGTSHSPDSSSIQEMIRGNVPGLRRYLAAAPSSRAADHAFKGKCDTNKSGPRRTDE